MYIVLVEISARAAVAAAPLTGQSAWTVPAGRDWSLHLWDGAGEDTRPLQAAATLADVCGTSAFVYWWSHTAAGYALFHKKTLLADQSWPPPSPPSPPSPAPGGGLIGHLGGDPAGLPGGGLTGEPDHLEDDPVSDAPPEVAAAELDKVFRRPPGYREAIERHLSEPHDDADATLRRLLELLGLDTSALSLDQEGLTIWAAAQPGVRRTPVLTGWRAMRHYMREAPPSNEWERVERERPTWYRVLNLVVGLGMAAGTAVLFLNWRWGYMSGWWVLLGVFATVSYLASARPGRRRRD